jgi:hypothetical protein
MEYKLPDFDEMLSISDRVGDLTTNIGLLKVQLDDLLAVITKTVMADSSHWHEGATKPPAMNYIQVTFHRMGLDEETEKKLNWLRREMAERSGEAGKLRMVFSVYRDMIDVWKADQYAKRDSQY